MAHADSAMNHFVNTVRSQPFIWEVTKAEIKCTRWNSGDPWQHLKR